jgi:hypothetical protein
MRLGDLRSPCCEARVIRPRLSGDEIRRQDGRGRYIDWFDAWEHEHERRARVRREREEREARARSAAPVRPPFGPVSPEATLAKERDAERKRVLSEALAKGPAQAPAVGEIEMKSTGHEQKPPSRTAVERLKDVRALARLSESLGLPPAELASLMDVPELTVRAWLRAAAGKRSGNLPVGDYAERVHAAVELLQAERSARAEAPESSRPAPAPAPDGDVGWPKIPNNPRYANLHRVGPSGLIAYRRVYRGQYIYENLGTTDIEEAMQRRDAWNREHGIPSSRFASRRGGQSITYGRVQRLDEPARGDRSRWIILALATLLVIALVAFGVLISYRDPGPVPERPAPLSAAPPADAPAAGR